MCQSNDYFKRFWLNKFCNIETRALSSSSSPLLSSNERERVCQCRMARRTLFCVSMLCDIEWYNFKCMKKDNNNIKWIRKANREQERKRTQEKEHFEWSGFWNKVNNNGNMEARVGTWATIVCSCVATKLSNSGCSIARQWLLPSAN